MTRNDFKGLIEGGILMDAVETLRAQGMLQPTFKSVCYLLTDLGKLHGKPGTTYKNFNGVLSKARDNGSFDYGVFAPEGGEERGGMTAKDLEETIALIIKKNVEPVLVDGVLKAVLVEKRGLLDYLGEVLPEIPVGSSSGQIRKEWSTKWARYLKKLATQLGATEIEITYLGDRDKAGDKIKRKTEDWWMIQHLIPVDIYAVHPSQAAALGHYELHIDGYIVLTGPQTFARELRDHLGLPEGVEE